MGNFPDFHSGILGMYYIAMEKEMANHSNTLAWKTPWGKKPGRL